MYTVLMPVDGDEKRTVAQAQMIVELPHAAETVDVILVHVFEDLEQAETTDPSQVGASKQAKTTLTEAGIEVEEESRQGNVATEIVAVADEADADLIVLGGRKRSPLGSALFGSVSQDVMLEAERPVAITGEVKTLAEPTHRCQSCGEEYYSNPDVEISTCRSCGGSKVEQLQ